MSTLRENVETFLNCSIFSTDWISSATAIVALRPRERFIGEANARLANAVNREADLAQVNHDLAVARMELETLNVNVAKAREVWSQLMGSAPS